MDGLKQFNQARVSSVTHDFREALQSGEQPSIERCLAEAAEADRTAVFRELLSLELSRLRRSAAEPRLEAYLERFPEFEVIVREQFIGFDSFQMSMDSTKSHDTSRVEATSGLVAADSCRPQLERYRLLEQLGQGGFGQVWRAFDDQTNRYVAIKGPRADRGVTPPRVARFLAEAQRVREINVNGVVKVLDVVHTPETPTSAPLCFIVMELMEGGSLADRLGAGIGRRQAVRWVASLSETLAELHRHDVVHRDIKPENILFDKRGRLYLSDFGLAATEAEQLAEGPGVLGTVAYMAPEQARGTHVDRRADIYSLGVVLYRLLSGNKLPYLANNRDEFLRQLLDEHVAPRAMPETVPSQLARVCERCVHKQASQRYRTAAELGKDLRFWLNRHRVAYLVVGVAIIGIILALVFKVSSLASHGQPTALPEGSGPASRQVGGIDDRAAFDPRTAEAGTAEAGTADPGTATAAAGRGTEPEAVALRPLGPAMDPADVVETFVDPLVWPHDNVSTWSLLDAGNTVHVSSNHISLLGVGRLKTGQDLSFDVDIRQLEWTGSAGVFLGHRFDREGKTRFELIELRNYEGEFECLRSVRDFEYTPDGMSEFQLARAKVPPPNGPQALSIDIKQGRVAEIRWNGKPLAELVKVPSRQVAKIADCSGAFGFFNMASAAAFSRLHLNGKLVYLRERNGTRDP